MRIHRALIVGATALTMILTTVTPGTAHHKLTHDDGPKHPRTLGPGDVTWWTHPPFEVARDAGDAVAGRAGGCGPATPDAPEGGACRVTTVEVRDVGPGDRLRAAVDAPFDYGTSVEVAVYGPNCEPADDDCPEYLGRRKYLGRDGYGGIPFSSEVFVVDPAPGTWRVVAYSNIADSQRGYRMRAAVDRGPRPTNVPVELRPRRLDPPAGDGTPLLPNLRIEPPFAPTFGKAGSDTAPGTACKVDEVAFEGADTCLRFAFGWQNVGNGPLWIDVLDEPAPRTGDPTEVVGRPYGGHAYQSVLLTDGTTRRLPDPVGEWHLHTAHQHHHYTNFFEGRAYLVTGSTPAAEPFATSKVGGCSHDWKFADIGTVGQAPISSQDSGLSCTGAVASPTHDRIGLSTGWMDVYGRAESGNMVPLGGHAPVEVGETRRYLIVFEADPLGLIAETVEDDNVGYAIVDVTRAEPGTKSPYDLEVKLVERGRGASPWDPKRVVLPRYQGCDSPIMCAETDLAGEPLWDGEARGPRRTKTAKAGFVEHG